MNNVQYQARIVLAVFQKESYVNEYIAALIGGVIIGGSASMLLLFNGRIFGISGIIGGLIKPNESDLSWRWAVLAGLFAAGAILYYALPGVYSFPDFGYLRLAIAGFLVGVGTQWGGGCTSGHGVCGISRMSIRSLVATMVFILAGAATVLIMSLGGKV